jgi:hypothetical protein
MFAISLIVSPINADTAAAPDKEHYFRVGMNPGIAMRLEQGTANAFKSAMGDLFPKIAKLKIGLPKEFHYKVGVFVDYLSYTINITNINYDDINLEMDRTKIFFR